jgi:Spirocyclase AveC-like
VTAISPAPPVAATAAPRTGWRPVQYLALVGVALAALEVWTWASWLAAGPRPVTRWRDSADPSWYAARVYEGLMVLAVIGVSVAVVRGVRRERRLTLDAMMVIGGASTLFWDPMVNWLQPNFLYSSNWLNLNTWVCHVPAVPNPDGCAMPQPVFIMLIYPFGLVLFAMVLTRLMSWMRSRWPGLTTFRLVASTFVAAGLICVVLEAPMFLLHLWALPGAPAEFALFGDAHRFAWAEYLTTTLVFGLLGVLRYFRDDKGRSLVERNLGHLTPGRRALTSVFATIAYMNGTLILLIACQVIPGMHAAPYPKEYPAHLVNGLCDAGPFTGTRYGPCPGSPGFRIPVQGSLPMGSVEPTVAGAGS